MTNEQKACAKIKFDSKAEAYQFAEGMKETIANELEAYQCSICTTWHIKLAKEPIKTALCS